MLLSKIKLQIKRVEVVSFDIFDTLLLRPYARPIDVFYHMELHYKKPGFCDARISAERAARKKHAPREDIIFDNIYDCLDARYASMKHAELDWEYNILQPNPEMRAVWDYAKKCGKKIVVASDMYLPTDFIARVLQKNGFGDYDKLYVSGDLGCAKWTGHMFDLILSDFNVAPNHVLHIGDNKGSDFKTPRTKQINAYKYRQILRQFLKDSPRAKNYFSAFGGDLGGGILTAMMAMRWNNARFDKTADENYWHKIGYEYGGPVIYAYGRFIEKTALDNNISHLMFVARDGYTLQRIFKTFNTSINTSYVYAPRLLKFTCLLDYNIFSQSTHNPRTLINFFATKYKDVADLVAETTLITWDEYHNFIENNRALFEKYACIERENYKNYLQKIINKSKCLGLIDSVAATLSAQTLVKSVLGQDVSGIYWTVLKNSLAEKYNGAKYIFADNSGEYYLSQTKNWNFMEFLMTAPEFPIKGINPDGTPVYDANPSDDEKTRRRVYPFVSDGAVEFAMDVKRIFNGADIYLNSSAIVAWVNCLCDYPTKRDMREMAIIKHACDEGHTNYQPLFSVAPSVMYTLCHPFKVRKMVANTIWKTPLQKFLLQLAWPVKIRMRGLRKFYIAFLPFTSNRYFTWEIRFSDRMRYGITIGKMES